MEELVNKLANLQARFDKELANADFASANIDDRIRFEKEKISMLEKEREINRRPFEDEMSKIDEGIEDISAQIIHDWNPETMKKTIKFPVGILTLRTTQSLDIRDPAILLDNLISHFTTYRIANEFISGFKKTIVKKFINMHPQSSSVAELVPKTTVKLEVQDAVI